MKRIRSTYHTLRDFKVAGPTLPRAIIANCNRDTVKSICECALKVLHGNIPLSACSKRNLRIYKNIIRKVADKSVSLAAKQKFISQRGGFILPLLSAILPTIAGLLFRSNLPCCIKWIWSRPNILRSSRFQRRRLKKSGNCRKVIMISGLSWVESFGKRTSLVRRS